LAGHLLVTATVDLLVWVALVYLVVRILAAPPGASDRLWVVAGLVAGVGLLAKALPAVLLLGLLAGGLLTPAAHPRLRTGRLWIGVIPALAIWTPYLICQARNGWPQLELGRQIAASTASPASASPSSRCSC
jgi:4-amino-4-deoxy-L-arabinose transferase-like glycosyltransferase